MKLHSLFALLIVLLHFALNSVQASDPYPRNESIDIRHYRFNLELNDSTNIISGEATITIFFKKPLTEFNLDLANVNAQGSGMTVAEVLSEDQPLKFSHQGDRLNIQAAFKEGEERKITVRYRGIPQDGLYINKNRYGDRTFFGDNWPDRAHHWLPTIDHPYDKATCEFIVIAPDHYSVIATGMKTEESAVSKKRKLTHWRTSVVLPTKVMVIGVARFAVEYLEQVNGTPVQSWVYPQNREEGFSDYAVASRILDYFSKNIAAYPYEKLANVQSTTIYGGMENAGNIFYHEKSVTGKGTAEGLIAHEIAHQWFGDSASENDWYHVWLSEGFATYGTELYLEATYGRGRLMDDMKNARSRVIEYATKSPAPVVNTSLKDIKKVLNPNSYQKGAWVLHMLRREIGDQKFWESLRAYYQQYQLSNAITDDLRRVMETVSGKDLKKFFDQWLFAIGQPTINASWSYHAGGKEIILEIAQTQPVLFDFPLEIGITSEGGATKIEKVRVSAKKQQFSISSDTKPTTLSLDPEVWLLFNGNLKEKGK